MGARELLPVFFSYCRRMLRAFLLVALGGATLFVVTSLYRAPFVSASAGAFLTVL